MNIKSTMSTAGLVKAIDLKKKQIKELQTKGLDEMGKYQVVVVQHRIRSSKTDPNGQAWQPWSIATLRSRMKEGTAGRGLLYRTGALLSSIKYTVSKGRLTIFSDAPYARFLHFGTPRMPARKFLGWGNQLNTIKKQLVGMLK